MCIRTASLQVSLLFIAKLPGLIVLTLILLRHIHPDLISLEPLPVMFEERAALLGLDRWILLMLESGPRGSLALSATSGAGPAGRPSFITLDFSGSTDETDEGVSDAMRYACV